VSILRVLLGVEDVDAGGHHDGAHVELADAFALGEVDGDRPASPHAFAALAAERAAHAALALGLGHLLGEAQLHLGEGAPALLRREDGHLLAGNRLGPLALLGGDVMGAAGAVALRPGASTTTTAMYLLRFGMFLPRSGRTPSRVSNIPGDGAIYQRDRILEHPDLLAEGFWEVEFHRRWLDMGGELRFDHRPMVVYHGPATLGDAAKLRYRHGFTYGSTMVLRHRHSQMRHILSAPLLPALLTARIIRRATAAGGGMVLATTRALLPLLALTTAWSLGEAVGAARARRPPR